MSSGQTVPIEARKARQILLDCLGFDLFASPRFAEHLVCYLANLIQTPHGELWDGTTNEGKKVEVKYATAKRYPNKGDYFVFSGLHGDSSEGKGADVFVLVGNDDGKLRFFVLASCRVEVYPKQAWIPLGGGSYEKTQMWFRYEVQDWQVGKAVRQAIDQGEMYEGLNGTQRRLFN